MENRRLELEKHIYVGISKPVNSSCKHLVYAIQVNKSAYLKLMLLGVFELTQHILAFCHNRNSFGYLLQDYKFKFLN